MDSNIFPVPDWPQTGTFVLKEKNPFNNKDILNEKGELIYSFHVRQKKAKQSYRLETDLGYLLFSNTRPDIVELFNKNDSKIGQLLLKEKIEFLFELEGKQFAIGNLESGTLSIKDSGDNIHLSIKKIEGDKESKFRPYYYFSYQGKIRFEQVLLLTLFVVYFDSKFRLKMYPTDFTFKAKINTLSIDFYDKYGNCIAKSKGSKFFYIFMILYILLMVVLFFTYPVLGIILFFSLIFFFVFIGFIIPFKSEEPIILEESGEKIASYKYDPRMKKASFTVPSRNWSGTITFENQQISDGISPSYTVGRPEKTEVFNTSDGNYVLKNFNRIEGCLSIYGIRGNYLIQIDSNFDNYKSLVLCALILRKYYDSSD